MLLSQLTQDQANHLFPGQRTMQDAILGVSGGDERETVTAGALSAAYPISHLSVTGTQAYTLPDGSYLGQRKRIMCSVAATTPAGTLTITTPLATAGLACASTFFFDTVGQGIDLVWHAAGWQAVQVYRAGGSADNVVVGTTVLTGKNLWAFYGASVTATVSSTGANALPNGSAVGERCVIFNTTAASTPVGSIDGVYTGMTGAAYTHMGAIGVAASTTVTGDFAMLRWTGAAWLVESFSGITWS